MRVLWILGELPIPADSGAKLRIMGLLKELAGRHAITAVALDPGTERARDVEELESVCESVVLLPSQRRPSGAKLLFGAVANLFSRLPYSVAKYCTRDTEYALAQVAAAPFDLIQCENIGFHRYLLAPASAPRILATHNVESDILRQRARFCIQWVSRAYFRSQAARMACYERQLMRQYDQVTAVSEEDALALQSSYSAQRVRVVANGVDTNYYAPTNREPEPDLLIFTGALDYAPNDDAMRYFLGHVWPRIVLRRSSARLLIVGRAPSARLRRLANALPGVTTTGWVSDTRPHLARASIVVVPLRIGGGSRLKILEATAIGRPVVSTSVGAAGLAVVPDKHLLIADEPDVFAQHVLSVLNDPGKGRELARAARLFVVRHHTWPALARRLERVWEDARAAAGAPVPAGERRAGGVA